MKFQAAFAALALCATFDSHAALIHQYELNGSLADAKGGPALVANGGTVDATGYSFNANQGLQLREALGATYTIDMVYHFNSFAWWQKIVDYKGLTSDYGFYNRTTAYSLYNYGKNAGTLTANQDTRLTLTRAADKTFSVYKDGELLLSLKDTEGYADFAGNYANFFRDDRGGGEAGAGRVDFIHIYDNVLSAAQVYALMDPSQVPEPTSGALMMLGVGALGATMARGKRRAG